MPDFTHFTQWHIQILNVSFPWFHSIYMHTHCICSNQRNLNWVATGTDIKVWNHGRTSDIFRPNHTFPDKMLISWFGIKYRLYIEIENQSDQIWKFQIKFHFGIIFVRYFRLCNVELIRSFFTIYKLITAAALAVGGCTSWKICISLATLM